jgi:hypothetical protein
MAAFSSRQRDLRDHDENMLGMISVDRCAQMTDLPVECVQVH